MEVVFFNLISEGGSVVYNYLDSRNYIIEF